MADALTLTQPVSDPVRFAARMTNCQFGAIAARLSPSHVPAEMQALLLRRRPTKGQNCDNGIVARWLKNGWSTEQLLRFNKAGLQGDALRHSLHWAFPQAYYSVFAVCLAYFKAVGYTEESHASVIRKFGLDVVAGRYPPRLASLAHGGKHISFTDLSRTSLPTSLTFDPSDVGTVDGQIAQLLKSTREMDLRAKKGDMQIRTKRGKTKKALSAADWDVVSARIGPTSLLNFLYRKRIKANYRDIDTFLHQDLEVGPLYDHLLRIVGAVNFVHEVLIVVVLGLPFLEGTLGEQPEAARDGPTARLNRIKSLSA